MKQPVSDKNAAYVACGCHKVGRRIMKPGSLSGLERWYEGTARDRKKYGMFPGPETRTPDDAIFSSRDSALSEAWDHAHPWIADTRPAPKFKGIKQVRGLSSDAILREQRAHRSMRRLFMATALSNPPGTTGKGI